MYLEEVVMNIPNKLTYKEAVNILLSMNKECMRKNICNSPFCPCYNFYYDGSFTQDDYWLLKACRNALKAEHLYNEACKKQIEYHPISEYKCRFCGSSSFIYVPEGNKIKIFCKDCHSNNYYITKNENAKKRTNTRLNNWAKNVKKRDGYRCFICGATENLHAHHLISVARDESLKYEISNGLTVCESCHLKIHGFDVGNDYGFNQKEDSIRQSRL